MNDLSWIIYAAELSQNLKNASMFGVVVFLLVAGFYAGIVSDSRTKNKWSLPLVLGSIVLSITAAILPTQSTVLLIGASQIGEQVIALKDVQELGGEAGDLASDTIKLLREIVAEQLAD